MSTRLTSQGVLLYCEGWEVLEETPRKIHIAEEVALGPQQLWKLCRNEVFIQGTQLFSLSSALALSPHCLSKRRRSNVLTYLCHLVSSFNLKHLPDTVFCWFWTWKQEFTVPASWSQSLGTVFRALAEKKSNYPPYYRVSRTEMICHTEIPLK